MKTKLIRIGNKFKIMEDAMILLESCTKDTLKDIMNQVSTCRKYNSMLLLIKANPSFDIKKIIKAIKKQYKVFSAPNNKWYEIGSRSILKKHKFIYIEVLKKWYVYTEGIYQKIETLDVEEVIKQYLNQCDDGDVLKRLAQLTKVIKINCHINIEKLNNYPNLRNLKNGILNLTTMTMEPHSDEYYFTYKMQVEYLENPLPTPAWDKFCIETVDAENAEMIKIFLNGLFMGNRTNEFMLWLVGKPNSGKSLLLDLIGLIFKGFGLTKTAMSSLGGPFGLQNICDGMLNIDADVKEDAFGAATISIFKKLEDSDSSIDVNKKNTAQTTMDYKGFLMSASNNLPTFKYGTDTQAIFKRVAFIDFPEQFPNNPTFKKELFSELNSIFTNIINQVFTPVKTDIKAWIKKNSEFYSLRANYLRQILNEKYEYRTSATHVNWKTPCNKVYGFIMRQYLADGKSRPVNLKRIIGDEILMMDGDRTTENKRDYFINIAKKELI